MRRFGSVVVVILLLLVGVGALRLYSAVDSLEHERVSDDVSVIFGLGGNVGVLRTERGAVVVDSMTFIRQGRGIRELSEHIGGGPVQAVLNTHYHSDHTHGNPGFASGTKVVATERTLQHLRERDGDYWQGEAAGTLPNETFEDRHQLRIGGKTIRAIHPGSGHTDGDMVVLFVEDRVLHAGDLFFNGRYPSLDLEAGGSIRGWIDSIDRVLELEFDRVIPGHGPVTDRAGLVAYREFLVDLWTQVSAAADQGLSKQQAIDSIDLAHDEGYGIISIPFVVRIDRPSIVGRTWEEAMRSPASLPVPPSRP